MSDFKGRHFGGEIVLWAVRWYCRYPIFGLNRPQGVKCFEVPQFSAIWAFHGSV